MGELIGLDRANALLTGGALADAEEAFQELIAGNPQHPDVLHGLGLLAAGRGQFDQARDYMRGAVSWAENPAIYLASLGDVERRQGDLVAAEASLSQAIAAQPNLAEAHNNMGMLRLNQADYHGAVSYFREAARLKPEMPMAHYNLGIALREMNDLPPAIAAYRQAIGLKPDFVEAHVNLALALLLDGQLQEGFEQYEWRRQPPFMTPPSYTAPVWQGDIDTQGSLLLHTEQGAGDVIQMARYIPFIAQGGMRVIVQCPEHLENLLQSVEGVASTYRPDEDLPPYTAQLSLLSLPRLFKTTLDKIPVNIPYLRPPFASVQAWRQRLLAHGETIKVGLRWSGNPGNSEDHRRSCPLHLFAGLAGVDKLSLVNLQNEPLHGEEAELAAQMSLFQCPSDLTDFIDTAALISNLDLVISVDTAVLHLAGALGIASWGLLRYSPHWPWQLGRNDSPWYPSLRLYRQPQPGDWRSVVDQVVAELIGAMQTSRCADIQ